MPVVSGHPLCVVLADDLLDAQEPVLKQMTDVFNCHCCSVLAVQDVPRADTRNYGIVATHSADDRIEQASAIVEKPHPAEAPSTLAVVGRYILTPRVFHHLQQVGAGAGGEIQLTDGIAALMREERVLAYRFAGTRYDCVSKLGYLQANVAFGLRHPQLGEDFREYLKSAL